MKQVMKQLGKVICYVLLFLWIFFKIRKKKLSQESGIKSFELRKAVPIALLGMSFSIMVSMLLQILPIPEAVLESYAQSSDALVGGHIVMILLADIVIAPVTEEIVFRGLVLSRLHKAMPAWAAVGMLPITEDMCLPIGISAAAVSAVLVCLVFRKGKEEADVITNKIQEGTI